MSKILLYGVIAAISGLLLAFPRKVRSPLGWLAFAVGVSVFAIRLQHDPSAWPQRGNLLSGGLALLLGVGLVRPWFGDGRLATLLTRAVLAATPSVDRPEPTW